MRRAALALAAAAVVFDVAIAVVWRHWCRDYAADDAELEALLKDWP